MATDSLKQLVSEYPNFFRGVNHESEASLTEAEKSLGRRLPESVRWYLLECGYGDILAIPSLQGAVKATISLRNKGLLPDYNLLIDDRGDAGFVVLDISSSDGAVHWAESHDIDKVARGNFSNIAGDTYPTFTAWVAECIEQEKAFSE